MAELLLFFIYFCFPQTIKIGKKNKFQTQIYNNSKLNICIVYIYFK